MYLSLAKRLITIQTIISGHMTGIIIQFNSIYLFLKAQDGTEKVICNEYTRIMNVHNTYTSGI